MSDESPEVTNVAAAQEETYVISQKKIQGKVFDHLVPNPMKPNSWVSLRRLSEARKRAINDKYNVQFGSKAMNVKFGNAFEQQQSESFVAMGGWSSGPGQPLESTAENFIDFVAPHQFIYEGDTTTVWTRCDKMIDEQLYGAEKNS
jgi:hypothetical protein